MELNAPNGFIISCISGVLHLLCACDCVETVWQSRNRIAVTHPDLTVLVESFEERIVEVNGREVGATIFATSCRLHFAAKRMAHELRTIADSENRHTASELIQVNAEGFRVIDAIRAACKDDANHIGISDGKLVVGQYLAKGVEFTKAASNELSRLRTEVQDDYFLLLHIVKIMCTPNRVQRYEK